MSNTVLGWNLNVSSCQRHPVTTAFYVPDDFSNKQHLTSMSLEKYFDNSEILKKIIKLKNFNSFFIKKFGKLRQSDMNYKFLEFFLEFELKSVLRFLDENSMAPLSN